MISYIESTRAVRTERNTKVMAAVTLLRKIVSDHFFFDEESLGSPMAMEWVDFDSETGTVLRLQTTDRKDIPKEDIEHIKYRSRQAEAVGFAALEVGNVMVSNGIATAIIIETSPPNVRGYDGAPVPTEQIDGVIADLHRYEAALAAQ